MNHCFNIPELVVEICLYCDKNTLATLGHTARLFDCALDALWSGCHDEVHIIYLEDLVQCFPSGIRTRLQDGRLALSSTIEPYHWMRFNFYARRIRVFHLDMSDIDPAFLALLVGYKPPGGILPNLKEASFRVEFEDELIHIHEFLSPELQTLEIRLVQEESISGSILASLLHRVPMVSANLSSFELHIYSTIHFLALHTLLGNLRRLRQLTLHLSTEDPPPITFLPELNHLYILPLENSNVVSPSVSTFASDSLMVLDLTSSPKHICALFRLLPKFPLESLSLTICHLGDVFEFAEIVRVATDKCQPHSLCRVKIVQHIGSEFEITGEHLAPFLAFPNITRFEHRHFGSLRPDDSFISSIATSWPQLAHLDLNPSKWSHHAGQLCIPRVTAKSFNLLATHCSKLTFIGLEFDATIIISAMSGDVDDFPGDKPASLAIQEVCNGSVDALAFGYSPIAEPVAVAKYLRSLFPNTTRINFSTPLFMEPTARQVHVERWRSLMSAMGRRAL